MIEERIFSYSLSPIRLLLKKLHNHHSNLVGKLANREVLVIFNPVIEHLGYAVCDVVTLDGRYFCTIREYGTPSNMLSHHQWMQH
jgi:hypothetical protein